MPRNPKKTRCQVSYCRAWAMRGHTHCRSHRDGELGLRNAGAPPRNLNAVKHAGYSSVLPAAQRLLLAEQIIRRPDDLISHLGPVIHSLQRRTGDPIKNVAALSNLLAHLVSCMLSLQLEIEIEEFLRSLPAEKQKPLVDILRSHKGSLNGWERLSLLRAMTRGVRRAGGLGRSTDSAVSSAE